MQSSSKEQTSSRASRGTSGEEKLVLLQYDSDSNSSKNAGAFLSDSIIIVGITSPFFMHRARSKDTACRESMEQISNPLCKNNSKKQRLIFLSLTFLFTIMTYKKIGHH